MIELRGFFPQTKSCIEILYIKRIKTYLLWWETFRALSLSPSTILTCPYLSTSPPFPQFLPQADRYGSLYYVLWPSNELLASVIRVLSTTGNRKSNPVVNCKDCSVSHRTRDPETGWFLGCLIQWLSDITEWGSEHFFGSVFLGVMTLGSYLLLLVTRWL